MLQASLGVASNATWWSTARSGGADGLGAAPQLVGLGDEVVETETLPTDPASVEAFAKCCSAWEAVAKERQDALWKWTVLGVGFGAVAGAVVGLVAGRRGL